MAKVKKKNQRNAKLIVSFDKDARKEYLLGFHKRKKQRREEALRDLKSQAKADHKGSLSNYYANNTNKNNVNTVESTLKALGTSANTGFDDVQVKTTSTEVENKFSGDTLGSSKVTIQVTELEDVESAPIPIFKEKKIKLAAGKAEKMLRKIQSTADKKKSRKNKTKKKRKR